MNYSGDNKKIAKNTLFLYLRMIYILLIGLYTSRLVLKALGFVDYGLYNVIGGFVVIFASLNTAMAVSTSRFFAYEIGKKEKGDLNEVYSNAFIIHFLVCVLFFVLSETVGYWFTINHMEIASDRLFAAKCIYHFSVLGGCFSIMTVPFSSLIIAQEHMQSFAYLSIFDATLRILIATFLLYCNFDRLILYGLFIMLLIIMDFSLYACFCYRKFPESHVKLHPNKSTLLEMTKFSLWSLYGNFASVASTQGINVLLNMFGGPILNAARGIAVQVQTAVTQFATNFQIALNPQIVKSYSDESYDRTFDLIIYSARYTFFLLFILVFPLLLNIDYVLNLWLGDVPENTSAFVKLILIISFVNSMGNSIGVGIQASGKLKHFMSVVCTITLLVLPISYLFLKIGFKPIYVFYIALWLEFLNYVVKLYMASRIIGLPLNKYVIEVYAKSLLIVFLCYLGVSLFHEPAMELKDFIVETLLSISLIGLMVFLFGLNLKERTFFIGKFKSICKI